MFVVRLAQPVLQSGLCEDDNKSIIKIQNTGLLMRLSMPVAAKNSN